MIFNHQKLKTSDSQSAHDNEMDPLVTKSSVCFVIDKVITIYRDERTEVSRNSQIIYSEEVDSEDVDLRSIVTDTT